MRIIGDPNKKTDSTVSSPYKDILLSSVSRKEVPEEMMNRMQSIVDRGNIMDNKEQLKELLGVLVKDYGLDTSKLADGITDYKAKEQDMGYIRRQAERAKLGAGLTALGYANGGVIGDPKKPTGDTTEVAKPYVHPIYGFTIPVGQDLPYDDDGPYGGEGQTTGGKAMRAISSKPALKYTRTLTSTEPIGQASRVERQMMAESSGNPEAVSDAGARGLFQIMPATQKDLEDRGLIPKGLDPFNPKHSRIMRDAKINSLSELSWIKNPPQKIPEVNKLARIYASYNAGEGRIKSALEKAKADGVDIYGDPRAWFKYIPEETRGYLNKILFD